MESDDLKSVRGSIPSLVELGWTEMFGATEEERLAAGRLRKQLRAAGVTDNPEAYNSAVWKFELPSEADLQKSECGRATLELFRSNPPLPREIQAKPEGNVTPVEPVAAAAELAIPPREPPPGPSDDLGVRLEQERAAKAESERLAGPVHKWVKAEPTKGTGDRMPVSDWNSDASNQPLY
jgi:hypothetical protein